MVNYNHAKFTMSASTAAQLPHGTRPEVAFVGRSNVGKSSLMNKLFNRKGLVKVSSKPGKTTTINFFALDDVDFVDLPGYGFAKVSKAEKLSWGKMMQDYFATTEDLCHVFHLVDIRHEPSAEDKEMNMFLRQAGIPFTVVATKADKISRGARLKYLAPICRALLVQPWQVLPFSSEDGTGREELLAKIEEVCCQEAEQE